MPHHTPIGRRRRTASARAVTLALATSAALVVVGCGPTRDEGDPQSPRPSASADAPRAAELHARANAARADGRLADARADLEAAARLGDAGAAFELSELFDGRHGLPEDAAARADWLGEAARLGDPRASMVLGAALVAEDDAAARREGLTYLERAARAGNARAEYLLGRIYTRGSAGVTRDAAWGARWTARAAARGHPGAQRAYGLALMSGIGVAKDAQAAYVWLALAGRAGESGATRLSEAAGRRLSPDARSVADARIEAFTPRTTLPYADRATIAFVQARLTALGLDPGLVDGLNGPRTERAVRAYQERTGLRADGVVNEALVEGLRSG